MSLATADKNKPYVCTVYFATDKNLNFYFVSPPAALHCKNIAKNKYVSCAIYNSSQKVSSQKEGLQFNGAAKVITKVSETKKALALWNKANPGAEKYINCDNMVKKVITSKMYKIKPQVIKYFNEALYGDKESEIFKIK